jgi:hypothetical protein
LQQVGAETADRLPNGVGCSLPDFHHDDNSGNTDDDPETG